MADELSDDQWARMDAELYAGRKIQAIKLYRQFSGSDLKDAKDMMDARYDQLKQADPAKFAQLEQRKGCMPVLLAIVISFAYVLIALLSASRSGS